MNNKKLEEAKQLLTHELLSPFTIVSNEHKEIVSENVNKIINLIYEACKEGNI